MGMGREEVRRKEGEGEPHGSHCEACGFVRLGRRKGKVYPLIPVPFEVSPR